MLIRYFQRAVLLLWRRTQPRLGKKWADARTGNNPIIPGGSAAAAAACKLCACCCEIAFTAARSGRIQFCHRRAGCAFDAGNINYVVITNWDCQAS